MARNHKIHFTLTLEEKQKLQERASKIGLTLAGYVRYLVLNTKISVEEQ